ncbi:hypothetical protein DL96DRAFT_1616142 [Flagelloscypha sp. PMI_526]|nr:hypothetical protein DL96DRAFT_1616142 [Flagelloscypha sp. PMI_526]
MKCNRGSAHVPESMISPTFRPQTWLTLCPDAVIHMLPCGVGCLVIRSSARRRLLLGGMGAFDLLVGSELLGVALNLYLYGIVSLQYLTYKTMNFNDPIWVRAVVAVLFMIDTSQTIAEFYIIWYHAVENYANPPAITKRTWAGPLFSIGTAISCFIVQAFLISRLWRLTRRHWLCTFLIIIAFGAALCGVVNSIRAYTLVDVTQAGILIPGAIFWLSAEVVIDIAIAAVLVWALWPSRTGFTKTNAIVNRCIRTAIQSGLFPSIFAIGNLVAFVGWPKTLFFTVFKFPLGRIYSNALLYTVVARKELTKISLETADTQDSVLNSFPTTSRISTIQVHKETVTESRVVNSDGKLSMDRYIVFPPQQSTVTL